jgi:valyl-tRNA synthetase
MPERFTKVYLNWMYNLRDWCISRQLWWGHRIPVWHCAACSSQTVDYQDPNRCAHCSSEQIKQDPDVLDTWFSSGLWPHSTLGWPDDTEDLRYFYPSTVMETGYDILFFWVARMVMLGLENMKDRRGEALRERVPFRVIYLHGLVRDVEGQKMSKTRGNVIDPLQAVEHYGCDALRFALTVGNAPGNDLRLGAARMEAGRNFANKLWNASNFVLRNLKEGTALRGWKRPRPSHLEDRWILSRLNRLVDRVGRYMEEYQFGEAEQAIYSFLWDEYCDWYIELAKARLRSGQRPSPLPVLTHVLEMSLRLLHPFMPFVTEEIWRRLVPRLAGRKLLPESIVIAPYPEANLTLLDDEAEARFGVVAGVVRAVRNARAEFRLPPQRPIEAIVDPADLYATLEAEAEAIRVLARVKPLRLLAPDEPRPPSDRCLRAVVEKVAVLIPTEGVVDVPEERQRLTEELAQCETGIGRLETRLKDQQFLSKAPEEVVERERDRLQRFWERRGKIQELLSQLPA